jgi:hypothetical protein
MSYDETYAIFVIWRIYGHSGCKDTCHTQLFSRHDCIRLTRGLSHWQSFFFQFTKLIIAAQKIAGPNETPASESVALTGEVTFWMH